MGVCPSIDQLRGDPNAVPRALDATFHHMGNTEFLATSRNLRGTPLLYCLTLVRLITLRSATLARWFRISSCTPSVKKAFCLLSLRFSNGRTAILLSEAPARGEANVSPALRGTANGR